jgi:hypothetical protein
LHDLDGGADAGIVFLAGEVESVAGEFLVGAGQFDLAGGGIEIEKSVRTSLSIRLLVSSISA